MANILRGIVSCNKTRYQQDGYDLDLSYILPKIIAMGYPSENFESVYRNSYDDVKRFLDEKHKGHYLVINLCSERGYDPRKFHGRVVRFPFDDHGPPPLTMMLPFCQQVEQWLTHHPHNVVAIHCKAGKGRTGVMISTYLLYKRLVRDAEEAMRLFAAQRTDDGRGITKPSQKRYVGYFEQLMTSSRGPSSTYRLTSLYLLAVEISPPPALSALLCTPYFTLSKLMGAVFYTSDVYDATEDDTPNSLLMNLPEPVLCRGDVKVSVYDKNLITKDEMLHFVFNTFFVPAIPHNQQTFRQPLVEIQSCSSCVNPNRMNTNVCCCKSISKNNSDADGRFLSVVEMSNLVPGGTRSSINRSLQHGHGGRAGSERTLILDMDEMATDCRLGPEDLQVRMYFTSA